MYNPYNIYPCPYCMNIAWSRNYPFNYSQPMYNPYYSQEFEDQYFRYDDDFEAIIDDSRPVNPKEEIPLKDYGPEHFVINIEEATKRNNNYRTALWTGKHLQLTLMSIKVGEDIGLEVHPTVDQFLRIEDGQGLVQMGPSRSNLNYQRNVTDGFAIFVPAGTWHNVTNTGNRPLKLYSIYAPPHHPHGTVHATKAMAQAAE